MPNPTVEEKVAERPPEMRRRVMCPQEILHKLYVGVLHPKRVDFKIILLTIGGKKLKLTIWDTAGQERFGTLTNTYYRGVHGIILVYDVTRQETFTNLSDVWEKEVEFYSTNHKCIDFFVGNKVDRDSERNVTREGMSLAQEHNVHFLNVVLKLERMCSNALKNSP
ncbi:unnamed protein product, partial [Vitis vinifera]|uniref:Ras-related protein RABC2a n=1 Tax=Vitis vinifera TaxID=29760 RepID=D7TM17_VITVI